MKQKSKQGRYEVFTPRDLYEVDRSAATRLLKVTIVLVMAGMLAALHKPLLTALTSSASWLHR